MLCYWGARLAIYKEGMVCPLSITLTIPPRNPKDAHLADLLCYTVFDLVNHGRVGRRKWFVSTISSCRNTSQINDDVHLAPALPGALWSYRVHEEVSPKGLCLGIFSFNFYLRWNDIITAESTWSHKKKPSLNPLTSLNKFLECCVVMYASVESLKFEFRHFQRLAADTSTPSCNSMICNCSDMYPICQLQSCSTTSITCVP